MNGVAPGPIWTPLIPSTFPAEKVAKFGSDTPMKRPGQPNEVAPSFPVPRLRGFVLHDGCRAASERRGREPRSLIKQKGGRRAALTKRCWI